MPAAILIAAALFQTILRGQPVCAPFPPDFVPFTSVSYVTGPNSAGDRLLVGGLPLSNYKAILDMPLPAAANQRFCGAVPLAAGRSDTAYVPTGEERQGRYAGFANLLLDPLTTQPFPSSGSTAFIPMSRIGDIFAWRIAPPDAAPALAAFADDFQAPDSAFWRITDHEGPGHITRKENVFFPGAPLPAPPCLNVPDKIDNLTLFVPRVSCDGSYTKGGTGGELESLGRARFGRFDIAMKTSTPPGTVNAFFVYLGGENLGQLLDQAGTPRSWDTKGELSDANEIDIEILSKENAPDSSSPDCGQADHGYVNFSVHVLGGKSITYRHGVCFAPWQDFHTYSFEWRPDEVRWFIDGSRVYPDPRQIEVTIDGAPSEEDGGFQGTANVPQFPANIMFNHWTNGDPHWSAGPPSLDAGMVVREVRYTPLTE